MKIYGENKNARNTEAYASVTYIKNCFELSQTNVE